TRCIFRSDGKLWRLMRSATRGVTGKSGTAGTSALPEIPAETRIRDEARDQRDPTFGTFSSLPNRQTALDREAILRAQEARPTVRIGPLMTGANLSLGIRWDARIPIGIRDVWLYALGQGTGGSCAWHTDCSSYVVNAVAIDGAQQAVI